jgi:CRISPR-associated protein Cmr6
MTPGKNEMKRPLFGEGQQPLRPQAPGEGNAGLWFDKVGHEWGAGWELDASKQKNQWLDQIHLLRDSRTGRAVGNSGEVSAAAARLKQLVAAQGGTCLTLVTAEPFVTGLGVSSPLETGFAWHWSLGTPYLPGAGLKGLARSWAAQWEGPPGEDCLRIFGADRGALKNDPSKARTGSVRFFDLIPAEPVTVKRDVMTPHLGAYYAASGPDEPGLPGFNWPADWHKPKPLQFLVVDKGQTFVTGIAPVDRAADTAADDLRQAKDWLVDGLDCLGAGAKTGKGYGRFTLEAEGC